jgi:hypothetical protein
MATRNENLYGYTTPTKKQVTKENNPFYRSGEDGGLSSNDLEVIRGIVDTGEGNLVPLTKTLESQLSPFYNKVSGLQSYVESLKGAGSVKGYDVVSAEKIKKMVNSAYNNLISGVDITQQEGYAPDLKAANSQIKRQQYQQDLTYEMLKKAAGTDKFAYNSTTGGLSGDLFPDLTAQKDLINAENVITPETPPSYDDTSVPALTTPTDLTTQLNQSQVGMFESAYNDLSNQAGIGALNSQLAALKDQQLNLEQQLAERTDYNMGKTVSLGVIGGRQSEITRQMQEQLTWNAQRQSAIANQIQTANQIINTIMQYKQMDYNVAKDQYEAAYKQQMDMINYLQEERQFASDQASEDRKNAMANLNVMIKQIEAGDFDYSQLDSATQNQILMLENQAGLPIGFTSLIRKKALDEEVLNISTRVDPTGAQFADIIYRNKYTGELRTWNEYLGGVPVKSSGGGGGGGGGGGSSAAKDIVGYSDKYLASNVAESLWMLQDGQADWGTVWNNMKSLYPLRSNDEIDAMLGGGYDTATGKWWGNAYTGGEQTYDIGSGLNMIENNNSLITVPRY